MSDAVFSDAYAASLVQRARDVEQADAECDRCDGLGETWSYSIDGDRCDACDGTGRKR